MMYTEVMQRRGFLRFLAVLPGFALLGGPAPAKASVEPPTVICKTVDELFQRILDFVHTYPGAQVLVADDPHTREVGFAAFVRQGGYEISIVEYMPLSRLKASGRTVQKAFARGEGRRKVAHILSQGGSLDDVYWKILGQWWTPRGLSWEQWRASRSGS